MERKSSGSKVDIEPQQPESEPVEDSSVEQSTIKGCENEAFSIEGEDRPEENQISADVKGLKIITKCVDGADRKISVLDSAPHIDHYTIDVEKVRPSLLELHQSRDQQRPSVPSPMFFSATQIVPEFPTAICKVQQPQEVVKFGWIVGVLIRCALSILSGMLYMRISWVAGQAGLGLGTLTILLSSLVAVLTSLSMCAICTNGEVKGGGAYFMISRSLGPDFGGSVGIVFSLANVLNAGLNIAAFAETSKDLMRQYGAKIVDGSSNDMRIIGVSVLIILACVVLIGVDFEIKAQIVLLMILSASFVDYVVGTFMPPNLKQQSQGFLGYNWNILVANFAPNFRRESFFSVFAVYFPAATGIMAGANISGNLKNPSKDIPKGTLLAILLTTAVYLAALWMTGSSVIRDASGIIEDGVIIPCSYKVNWSIPCNFGLLNYFQTMEMQSSFGPLITAGIFAATLSSALACLVSGPRLFQAVCRDKLYPKIEWFAKSYGKTDEPKRAYILCFVICLGIVLVADVNSIAPYSSNFYLATYALINYACFHASMIQATGWRPSFNFYDKWLSLAGALLCIAGMFLMSYVGAICTAIFIAVLYVYLLLKKPDVNWGTSRQAEVFKMALENMLKLLETEEHVKNYRPQILALTGNPVVRPMLVDFVRSLTNQKGLMLLGHIAREEPDVQFHRRMKIWKCQVYNWLRHRRTKAFYCPIAAKDLHTGLQTLLQVCGLGKLVPNVVVMGFKNNWAKSCADDIWQYFQLIHAALDCEMSIGVLKVENGLDYSSVIGIKDSSEPEQIRVNGTTCSTYYSNNLPPSFVTRRLSQVDEENESFDDLSNLAGVFSTQESHEDGSPSADVKAFDHCDGNFDQKNFRRVSQLDTQTFQRITQFQFKPKRHGVVHVYWLFDDGGLTLLFPHILVTNKSFLYGAKVRIFVAASENHSTEDDEANIRVLLEKFRIQYAEITVISDINQEPSDDTVERFERLIDPFRIGDEEDNKRSTDPQIYITDAELEKMKLKTRLHLRTRELLMKHSRDASLIVITQPIPRKAGISACLYLAWLDFISKDLSPVFFVRGNQQDVLTFYS